MSAITCTVVHFKERRYFVLTDTGKVTRNLRDTVDCFICHIVKFKVFTRKSNRSAQMKRTINQDTESKSSHFTIM